MRTSGNRLGLKQQREQVSKLVAHFAPVDDHVDRAMLEQELGTLKPFGQRLAHGLFDHARTGEADRAPGSAITMSPIIAKLAETPPIVGSVSTDM